MNASSQIRSKIGLIALGLLVFLVVTAGALGVVWIRQQISTTAKSSIALEKAVIEVQRKQNRLDAKIAQIHNPDYLKKKIGARLVLPKKEQVVWVKSGMSKKDKEKKYAASRPKVRQPLAMAFNQPLFQKLLP